MDRFSSTTGFDHEINISRETSYLDLSALSQDIQTSSTIFRLLKIGKVTELSHLISF
jgi:hypothetical protein